MGTIDQKPVHGGPDKHAGVGVHAYPPENGDAARDGDGNAGPHRTQPPICHKCRYNPGGDTYTVHQDQKEK